MESKQQFWQEKIHTIMVLLKKDPESRQQAISLLDSLFENISKEDVTEVLNPIFDGINIQNASFSWMNEVNNSLRYQDRHAFRQEDVFWPLYELYIQIHPDRLFDLPVILTLTNLHRFPAFLTRSNPCKELIITNSIGIDGVEEAHGIDKIFLKNPYSLRFVPDLKKISKGKGDFVLFGPDPNSCAILFDEIKGKRELVVLNVNDTWMEQDKLQISIQEYPYLVLCNVLSSNLDRDLWDCKTSECFLTFGDLELHLSPNVEHSIRDRLEILKITLSDRSFESPFDLSASATNLFGKKIFPILNEIVVITEDIEVLMTIEEAFLKRFPQLTSFVQINNTSEAENTEAAFSIHPSAIKRLLDISVFNTVYKPFDEYPKALSYRMKNLCKPSPRSHSVSSFVDLQQRQEEKRNFQTVSPIFFRFLRDIVRKQKVPKHFKKWLRQYGVLRVGNSYLWINAKDIVCMKSYDSIGDEYFEQFTSSSSLFSTLNLERLFYGSSKGVTELSLENITAIRYNDPNIGIQELQKAPKLQKLHVMFQDLLEPVMELTNLKTLYLDNLGLSTLPENIGILSNLVELYLWNNQLSTLPQSISKMQSLEVINISGNQFTALPSVLLDLPNLHTICLRGFSIDETLLQQNHPHAWQRYNSGQLRIVS